MHIKELYWSLENDKCKWDKTEQLEIFTEEAKAQIIDIIDIKPENIKSRAKEIKLNKEIKLKK